jgi:2-iminoacetate synthase
MTLKEYLMDYASPATRAEGERMIQKSLTDIPEGRIREITVERLKRIENGEHDFRF